MNQTFEEWMAACEAEAMSSEWCIDESWPRWRPLYDEGKTPLEAVNALFEEIQWEKAP